jgi:hypothetical protein
VVLATLWLVWMVGEASGKLKVVVVDGGSVEGVVVGW